MFPDQLVYTGRLVLSTYKYCPVKSIDFGIRPNSILPKHILSLQCLRRHIVADPGRVQRRKNELRVGWHGEDDGHGRNDF